MTKACLVIHNKSYPYIKNVARTILYSLRIYFGQSTYMEICDAVESANIGACSYVFVIGENFKPYKKTTNKRYIYINFSVITYLGNPLMMSWYGFKLIRTKRQIFKEKLDLYDGVLDYYPAQTRKLKKQFNIPLAGFIPWVAPVIRDELSTKNTIKYDVCFVGSLSKRRDRILSEIKRKGYTISPNSGHDIENIALQSRCTLNIHAERSNHLEIPRIMSAIGLNTIITEKSYGIEDVIPPEFITSARFSELSETVSAFLHREPEIVNKESKVIAEWYEEVGSVMFQKRFEQAVNDLVHTIESQKKVIM